MPWRSSSTSSSKKEGSSISSPQLASAVSTSVSSDLFGCSWPPSPRLSRRNSSQGPQILQTFQPAGAHSQACSSLPTFIASDLGEMSGVGPGDELLVLIEPCRLSIPSLVLVPGSRGQDYSVSSLDMETAQTGGTIRGLGSSYTVVHLSAKVGGRRTIHSLALIPWREQ